MPEPRTREVQAECVNKRLTSVGGSSQDLLTQLAVQGRRVAFQDRLGDFPHGRAFVNETPSEPPPAPP